LKEVAPSQSVGLHNAGPYRSILGESIIVSVFRPSWVCAGLDRAARIQQASEHRSAFPSFRALFTSRRPMALLAFS